jgi:hypothetical protein
MHDNQNYQENLEIVEIVKPFFIGHLSYTLETGNNAELSGMPGASDRIGLRLRKAFPFQRHFSAEASQRAARL